MLGWNVYDTNDGYDAEVDTIFYEASITAEEVYHSLVSHDGYPASIHVHQDGNHDNCYPTEE